MAIRSLGKRAIFPLCALIFLSGRERPAGAADAPWGAKEIGVLLIGPDAGKQWDALVASVRKSLGKTRPLATVTGTFGARELQKALGRLETERVKKIVVISLSLYSRSADTDQLEYLLGLRQFPSEEYLDGWGMKDRVVKRAKAKVPIVLSGGLDDDAAVAEILLERAGKMSRDPKNEAVVLVGQGSAGEEENAARAALLQSVAGKMLVRGRYPTVRTALLRPEDRQKPARADKEEARLREMIYELSKQSRVIVVPYLLSRDGSERQLKKKLDNLFFRWEGEGLLPDSRIAGWVERQVQEAAGRPDMVKFKDDGVAPPPKKPGKAQGMAKSSIAP